MAYRVQRYKECRDCLRQFAVRNTKCPNCFGRNIKRKSMLITTN